MLRERERPRQPLNVRLDEVRAQLLRDDRPLPDAVQDRVERRRQVARLVASLPPQCGLVCALVFLEGLSHREVAQQLGISIKAVEKQVARGVGRLRDVARAAEDSDMSAFLDGGGHLIVCLQGIGARYRGGYFAMKPSGAGHHPHTKRRRRKCSHGPRVSSDGAAGFDGQDGPSCDYGARHKRDIEDTRQGLSICEGHRRSRSATASPLAVWGPRNWSSGCAKRPARLAKISDVVPSA